MKKHKINKKLLLKKSGYSVHSRYSQTQSTDDIGRWARIIYYNGIQIAWINGLVRQDTAPILKVGRTGICNHFHVSLSFPTSSQGIIGFENFEDIQDAIQYVKDMFEDFKKVIITKKS